MPYCMKYRDTVKKSRVSKVTQTTQDDDIPENCLIWFDGQNDCLCLFGDITSILTKNDEPSDDPPYCKEYLPDF